MKTHNGACDRCGYRAGWSVEVYGRSLPCIQKGCDGTCHAEEEKELPKAVLIGSTHRHYKNGKSYIVVDVPQNPNTEEMFVVYQPVDRAMGERSFVRPLDEFWEKFEETDLGRNTSAPKSFA